MKIVEKIGDFVIKETNEKERREYVGYLYEGRTGMENFYIYLKEHTASKFIDEYIDYADTLEEAKEIVEKEIDKKYFDILNLALTLNNTYITIEHDEKDSLEDRKLKVEKEVKDYIKTLKIQPEFCEVKFNYFTESFTVVIKFDLNPYTRLNTIEVNINEDKATSECIEYVNNVVGVF